MTTTIPCNKNIMKSKRKVEYGCPMCDRRFQFQDKARKHIREFDHTKTVKKTL